MREKCFHFGLIRKRLPSVETAALKWSYDNPDDRWFDIDASVYYSDTDKTETYVYGDNAAKERGFGLVDGKQPVFHGAQAEGCSPVAKAFAEGSRVCRPQKPDTIAKSLAIGDPADGPYAVVQANETGGSIDAVTDDQIREGIRLLAETTGIFTETAGGVTVGVLKKLAERGELGDGEKVVVYITGEGLKTLDANRDSFALTEIDPNPDSFETHFGQEVVA